MTPDPTQQAAELAKQISDRLSVCRYISPASRFAAQNEATAILAHALADLEKVREAIWNTIENHNKTAPVQSASFAAVRYEQKLMDALLVALAPHLATSAQGEDVARLDWLEKHGRTLSEYDGSWEIEGTGYSYTSARAAIDAARAAKEDQT